MNSRRKGKTGELEFSKLCRENGYEARRTAQYCGKTGDAADITGLTGIHVEVKRVEHLNLESAMSQSKRDARKNEIPIVAHRKNNCEWLVTMRAQDWFSLYREWETDRRL